VTLVDVGNGVRLNTVEQGAGKPILLVQGWPTNSRAWKHQLDALSREHRVLAVDLRGFGDSPPVAQPRIALLAEDVRRLLDAVACDFRASLPRVGVAALLLNGAHSTSTTPGVREFRETTIPPARLIVFEESGHVPMLEEMEKSNRALREFAKEVA
jgi:pimeloyl-ACP methyl ester carboxylesterase